MLLDALLRLFDPSIKLVGKANPFITGVIDDSRRVEKGNLFIARCGTAVDGKRFIGDAIARGAAAVVSGEKLSDCAVPHVRVADPVSAVGGLAHAFYERPSDIVKVLGITGTNGKTTTAYLIRHLLGTVQQKCGMIGTVEVDDGQQRREAQMTTPSAVELAKLLATMRDRGCRRCTMEVSSHALHQKRVAGIRFAGAGFTNLTQDHLDYHKEMDAYADAKALLFESLDAEAVAVINAGDPYSPRMVRDCAARVIRFGFDKDADYRACDIKVTNEGSHFVMVGPDGRAVVRMKLIGRHNIENALLASALVGECFGLAVHQLAAGLADTVGAPGRLQSVDCGQTFTVLVDYAHTDDALKNVLTALRKLPHKKLRVLFGCGGDRDSGKRPLMADVAQTYADAIYVTSDNPRSEDPARIIDQIRAGFSARPRKPIYVEVDRRRAIEKVLTDAEEGDVVLLAGKGHENYQIVGSQKHHFDDIEEARSVLLGRTGGSAAIGDTQLTT